MNGYAVPTDPTGIVLPVEAFGLEAKIEPTGGPMPVGDFGINVQVISTVDDSTHVGYWIWGNNEWILWGNGEEVEL